MNSRALIWGTWVAVVSSAFGCGSEKEPSAPAQAGTGGTGIGQAGSTAADAAGAGSGGTAALGGSGGGAPGGGGHGGASEGGTGGGKSSFLRDVGMPFVRGAFPNADGETPLLDNPEPGKLCLSGTVSSGWAALVLSFIVNDSSAPVHGLDLTGLGVARLRFKLEAPPADGISVQFASIFPGCTVEGPECLAFGFFAGSETSDALFSTASEGTISVSIASVRRASWVEPTVELDLKNLAHLSIGVGQIYAATTSYSYCVSEFTLLDSGGQEIKSLPE